MSANHGKDHARWLEVFEAVSVRKPDEADAEWKWLMKQLGLGPKYFLAVLEAIRQGRWRKAKNPRAYIKTVAKREARRMGLTGKGDELVLMQGAQVEDERFSGEEMLEVVRLQQDSARPVKGTDGVWRPGGGLGPDYTDPRGEYANYHGFLLSGVPGELMLVESPGQEIEAVIEEINASTDEFHIHLEPFRVPDWKRWAREAGLSEWEKRVVEYKLSGTSRERALAAQPNEVSRRALQAAWKSLERTGLKRLREAVKKSFPQDVPEEGFGDTR